MNTRSKLLTSALLLTTSVVLAACAGSAPPNYDQQQNRIDAVMEKAAADAKSRGESQESISYLEQLYKRNSSDPSAALKYAHALREQGYYTRAELVLKPFATQDSVKDAGLVTEYASIEAAMGNYIDAEDAARKAVLLDPKRGQAYHVLGIALDAQGHHEQAQVALQKALDHWEGNPSAVLNNIGLNLAAQGFLDEAIETLRKAQDMAPNRKEIERNLRIVSALQYQPPKEGMRLVPKPPRKPDHKDSAEAKKAEALKKELDSADAPPPQAEDTEATDAPAPVEEKAEDVEIREIEVKDVKAVPVPSGRND